MGTNRGEKAMTVRSETGRWKNPAWDGRIERLRETQSQHEEEVQRRRAGRGDSDLFLMPLTGNEQKECIITPS